jgi:hypothetical protein
MSFASYPTVILNCSVFYLVEIGLFCTICILIFVNSPACMHYFVLELFSKDLRNFLFYFAEMYFDRGNFYDFTSLGEYSINDFYCFNFSFFFTRFLFSLWKSILFIAMILKTRLDQLTWLENQWTL